MQAGVVTCDGAWHRVNVVVVPTSGAFSGGRVQVFVFLGVFDQDAGDRGQSLGQCASVAAAYSADVSAARG